MKRISIIIPILNEQATLEELTSRLLAIGAERNWDVQVVMVDDGSTDGTWHTLESLARRHPEVLGIRLRRNFGKAAALMAGIHAASAESIVTLDADLQDDPSQIPLLVAQLEQGYGVVSGWKQSRQDPWHKIWPSRFFNWMTSRLTGVYLHDHNCGLKAYRREIFEEVRLYGEMHRFIPVLAAARGWRVTEVPVIHHPRRHGQSKYGVSRFAKGFLDLLTVYFLTSFRQRPQHLLGTLGLTSLVTGLLLLSYLTLVWFISRLWSSLPDENLHERALFYYAILGIIVGVQLLSLGFLAELIISSQRSSTPTYSIAERTANPSSQDSSLDPPDPLDLPDPLAIQQLASQRARAAGEQASGDHPSSSKEDRT